MITCLDQTQLLNFLNYKFKNVIIEDEPLFFACDQAEQWINPISVLTYLFARILENEKFDNCDDLEAYLNTFYEFPNYLKLVIQEFDYKYITNLFKTVRNEEVSLEEQLVELQSDMTNNEYSNLIRY
ncbi:MAG: hypothetical protein CVU41_18980 [Chloroflexi bacterium HGW-Chloroflexi-3]|nr:MAG: hypothetical protein CVU41_18980 [Chloroflexi bacterium HGW-Chloroflexi-3]